MSEENTQTNNEQTLSTNDSTKADNKNVPYDRFTEVNTHKNDAVKEVQSLQAQIDKLNSANKAKEEDELAKQGEYKQLLENTKQELEQFKTKASQWDSYQTNRRGNLMERLTDDTDKEIADGLSLEKLEKYVDKVSTKNVPSTSQARAGNAKAGDFGGYSSYAEWATKDPQGYEKGKKDKTNSNINIGWHD